MGYFFLQAVLYKCCGLNFVEYFKILFKPDRKKMDEISIAVLLTEGNTTGGRSTYHTMVFDLCMLF